MTDINNSVSTNKLGEMQNINFAGNKVEQNLGQSIPEKEINLDSLDKNQAALAGRSMVTKKAKNDIPHFDGRIVANVKADLEKLNENPNLIAKSNAVREMALSKGYSLEQAEKIAMAFEEEFKA